MGFLKYALFLALVVLGTHAARLTSSALAEGEKEDVSIEEEQQPSESSVVDDDEEEEVSLEEEEEEEEHVEEEEVSLEEEEEHVSDADEEKEDDDVPMPQLTLETSEEQPEEDVSIEEEQQPSESSVVDDDEEEEVSLEEEEEEHVEEEEVSLEEEEQPSDDVVPLPELALDTSEGQTEEEEEEEMEEQSFDAKDEEVSTEVVIENPKDIAAKFLTALVALDFAGTLSAQDVAVKGKDRKEFEARDEEIHRELQAEARQMLTWRGQTAPESTQDLYGKVVSEMLQMGAFDKGRNLLNVMIDVCGDIWVAYLFLTGTPYTWDGTKFGPMTMPAEKAARYQNMRIGWLKEAGTFHDVVTKGADEWLLAAVLYMMVFDKTADDALKRAAGRVLVELVQNSNMYNKKDKNTYYPALYKHTPNFVGRMLACATAGIKKGKVNKWMSRLKKVMRDAAKLDNFPVGYRYRVPK